MVQDNSFEFDTMRGIYEGIPHSAKATETKNSETTTTSVNPLASFRMGLHLPLITVHRLIGSLTSRVTRRFEQEECPAQCVPGSPLIAVNPA